MKALLPRKDINIIIIVWDSYSYFDVTYTEAVTLFKLGEVIARFVQTLIDAGADRKNMNLIGDSDGAAAVALAAKRIYPRVGRLTGKCAEFYDVELICFILERFNQNWIEFLTIYD